MRISNYSIFLQQLTAADECEAALGSCKCVKLYVYVYVVCALHAGDLLSGLVSVPSCMYGTAQR